MTTETRKRFINLGSFVLGFGFLGALDGIIFHQILQWHSVLMATDRAGQIVSDGIFHLAVSITLVVGGILLWIGGNPNNLTKGIRLLIGSFLIGGGVFNLIEGIIDHHLLQIHRVRPLAENPLVYDLAFLASGIILVLIGYFIKRSSRANITPFQS